MYILFGSVLILAKLCLLLVSLVLVIIVLPFVFFGIFTSWQCLRTAEEEVEKMAAIAEQEKLKNINMEKQLQALGPPSTLTTGPVLSPVKDLQQALQEKDK